MSVGVWEPGGGAAKSIDLDLLESIAAAAGDGLEQVSSALLADLRLETSQWLMRCGPGDWAVAEQLDSRRLVALVRFFTLVERDVSGWEAGSKSPVIAFVNMLKARGEFTPELRKWIKGHSDNRYLPYGSVSQM
ncbi:MAG: hypothetical protein ACR2PJ_02540 [Pseudomonadales bacterium]